MKQTLAALPGRWVRLRKYLLRRDIITRYALPTLAAITVLTIGLGWAYHHRQYSFNKNELRLLGKPSVDVGKIKESATEFQYNRSDEKPQTQNAVTAAASPTDSSGQFPYQTTLPKKASDGVTFSDAKNELSFKMVPLDEQGSGDLQDGRVVYPQGLTTKQVYTFKRNGLKEDIILSRSPGKTASWQWKLELDDKLEAKLLPDGGVGLYSASPYLYGNLQVGDQKSQALVDKAKTADKSYLVFKLPAPFMKDAKGLENREDTNFKLNGNTLTLEARNLNAKHYPLTVDPSVVVTTTADFRTGTDDGMIDYGTNGQINRASTTVGTVASATVQPSLVSPARHNLTAVVSNGYIWMLGGNGVGSDCDANSYCNGVYRCALSGSAVDSCALQGSLPIPHRSHASAAYNNYIYVVGGAYDSTYNGSQACDVNNRCNDIQYCQVLADGSLGTCSVQQNAFTTPRSSESVVIYNDYLYIIGGQAANSATGCDSVGKCNDIQSCHIKSDGSVDTCSQQLSAFPTPRTAFSAAAYNGYLYITGGQAAVSAAGCDAVIGYCNDIIYCPLSSSGSVGGCTQKLSAFTTTRFRHTTVASGGYLYVVDGCSAGSCSTYLSEVINCPIYADGSVGSCTTQNPSGLLGRAGHASVVYNGYIYLIAGSGTGTNCDGNSRCNDIQRVQINTGTPTFGTLGSISTSYINTPRDHFAAVAYNGYLYIIGGEHAVSNQACVDTGVNDLYCNDIQRMAIGTDGSLGGISTSYFNVPRYGLAATAYNGYLYILGGIHTATDQACVNTGFNTPRCNDIQRMAINPTDGSLGSISTSYFSRPRDTMTATAYNGYLYIVGGTHATSDQNCVNTGVNNTLCNDIQRMQISPTDGSLGSISISYFNTPRSTMSVVAYNGYLYIIGGGQANVDLACVNTGVNNSWCNDIQRMAISSTDGSLGTISTSYFNVPRGEFTANAYNGYLYIVGGFHTLSDQTCVNTGANNQACNDIQRMPFNADGSLGAISTSYFNTPRYFFTAAVANGNLYLASGQHSATDQACVNTGFNTPYCNDIQRLPVQSPAQAAHYERVIDTSASNMVTSVSFNGTMPCGASMSYATAGTNGVFGSATNLPFVLPGVAYPINTGSTRYLWVQIVLDDSKCGGSSTVTDITTSYNASPATPTLTAPSSGAISVSSSPVFNFSSTDADGDYIRYKLYLYQSNCSTPVGSSPFTQPTGTPQTGWTGQDSQSSTAYASGSPATYTYQSTLSYNTTYCWKVEAFDPGGTNNNPGTVSATQLFTTNQTPSAPTLSMPADGQTGASLTPEFRFSAADPDTADYLKYRFVICNSTNSTNCAWSGSAVVQSIDQTSSQAGWAGQSLQSGAAYAVGQQAVHTLQTPLTANTQYWWRAYAIDPGGTNTWSSASSIRTFTTQTTATQNSINISPKGGDVNVYGGVTIGQ